MQGGCVLALAVVAAPASAADTASSAAHVWPRTYTDGVPAPADRLKPTLYAQAPISAPNATVPTPPAPLPKPAAVSSRLNPSGKTLTMVAPLKDREVYLGDVEIHVLPDDQIEVAAAQVFDLLKRGVSPTAVESLRSIAEPGVYIPLKRFADLGLPITFDPRTLELTIEIASTARARQSIGLADLDRELYGDFAKPAGASAYVNFNGSVDAVHKGAGPTGLGDPFVLMDGAVRVKSLVFEAEGAWVGADRAFSRDGARFVYDDQKRLNRWVVGDLVTQTRGFQGSQEVAGISVTRTYALLDPQRNIAPRGGRSFSVDRASTVEAFVNGRSVRTIRLQPGTYDVSDFPFVQGSNDVDLVIVDDAGGRETVSFSIFIDRTQLAPGISEYGFYAGVQADQAGRTIDYSDEYFASGFYRHGLSEKLTLGGNFQYAREGALVGAEAVWGSRLGTIGADVALSDLDVVGQGWAANISFDRLIQSETGGMSIVASFEARSRRFGTIGQLTALNPYSFNTSLGVNRSFGDSAFAGAQIRYAKGRDGRDDERTLRFTYGRRITDAMNLIVDVDWSDGGFAKGAGFRLALIRRFGATGSARAEYDSLGQRSRIGYQTSGGQGVGAWSAAGNLDFASDMYALNGSATYSANRADIGIAHTTAYSPLIDDVSDQRTSFRGAASLAFADGRFAVGRPISDSFVIVMPYAGGRGIPIEVDPAPEGYYARSGPFGPALYGQLSAYSPHTVTYDAPEAPPGFDVGTGAVRLLPPYRAGYLVTVGSHYGVTAVGRLLQSDGEPLALVTGVAIEEGGEKRRVEIFTNRQGAFGAGGLKAGRWRIEMLGEPPVVYDLVIPPSPDGLARAGDLRPIN